MTTIHFYACHLPYLTNGRKQTSLKFLFFASRALVLSKHKIRIVHWPSFFATINNEPGSRWFTFNMASWTSIQPQKACYFSFYNSFRGASGRVQFRTWPLFAALFRRPRGPSEEGREVSRGFKRVSPELHIVNYASQRDLAKFPVFPLANKRAASKRK